MGERRILNRHRRGRPRLSVWQKLFRALAGPAVVFGLVALGLLLAYWSGVF